MINFYEFGKFRFDAERCVLFDENNRFVDATPKALEILRVLIESSERLVSKEEIISRVWADSFVEEANLSHHIFRLRRALGESGEQKFIETVPKRGYRFIAEVREIKADNHTEPQNVDLTPENSIPARGKLKKSVTAVGILCLILAATSFVLFNLAKSNGDSQLNTKPETKVPMTISRIIEGGKKGAGTISPDGKFISYSENYVGTLYIRQIDTKVEALILEPEEGRVFGAKAFSPDGAYIYYLAWSKTDLEGGLYRISVLGGKPVRLSGNINYFFTISSDGNQAAFFRTYKEKKETSIIIAKLDGSGTEQTVLTFDDKEKSTDSVPAFSPDGKRLAFCLAESPNAVEVPPARIEFFTVEIDTRDVKKMSDEKWTSVGMMNWMPNSSGLIFVGYRGRTRNQIYFLSYPNGELKSVTNELSSYSNYGMGITADGTAMVADVMQWSTQLWRVDINGKSQNAVQLTAGDFDGGSGLTTLPNGEIIYTTRSGSDYDLWKTLDLNGKREGNPLTSDAFRDSEPIASRDGKSIVFSSDREGNEHLFRVDPDGSNLKQLTFGEGFESSPDVSPDGNWIVYTSSINNQNRIWKMPAGGGDSFQLTDYECLAPSVSPDGKQISCSLPSESRGKHGQIIIASFETGTIAKSFEVLTYDYYYCALNWTPDGKAVVFRRTDDQPANLWKQNLAGGDPIQLTDFKSDLIFSYAFTHDGKSIIISRGYGKGSTVMLEKFLPNR